MALRPGENSRPIICVFGSYEPCEGQPLFELAYHIGHELARAGFVVCNGGYGGTMLAAARGAKDAGGTTIGVTCSIFKDAMGQPAQPNAYIDREIRHDSLLDRIEAMMQLGRGFVILEGGTGTLAEFSIVWEFVCKKFIPPRPIYLVGEFWKPVAESILAIRPRHGEHLHFVQTADQIAASAGRLVR